MIDKLVPAMVAVSHCAHDLPNVRLFPEEEVVVRHAVERRYREYATVRQCARQALAALGVPAAPIVPNEHRAPRWPAGIVGSMTHCRGYRAVAVARAHEIAAIGIDAEPDEALQPRLLSSIARPEERRATVQLLHATPGIHWDRLLFSAKEAVYKVWSPLLRRSLDFTEVSITFRRDGAFAARILQAGAPINDLAGRWSACDGLLATAIVAFPPAQQRLSAGPTTTAHGMADHG